MNLVPVRVPRQPEGVVLVLHGGAGKGGSPVSMRQPSVVRMIPIAHGIARAGRGRLAVYRLLNSHRGWSEERTPVDDVLEALDEVGPAALVGHSLGGRAALKALRDDRARVAVALNPWVYASDGDPSVRGKKILIVHGDADRVADPRRSRAVADVLSRNNELEYVTVPGAGHAMLGLRSPFGRLSSEFVTRSLLRSGARPADKEP